MALTLKSTDKAAYTLVDPDTYPGYFKGYEILDLEFGPCVKMFFGIETDNEQEEEISEIASLPKNGGAMGTRHKLRRWLEGMRGKPLGEGEEVDLDKLIGTECRLQVTTVEKTKKDGTMGTYNSIVKIMPPKPKRGAARPVAEDNELI